MVCSWSMVWGVSSLKWRLAVRELIHKCSAKHKPLQAGWWLQGWWKLWRPPSCAKAQYAFVSSRFFQETKSLEGRTVMEMFFFSLYILPHTFLIGKNLSWHGSFHINWAYLSHPHSPSHHYLNDSGGLHRYSSSKHMLSVAMEIIFFSVCLELQLVKY